MNKIVIETVDFIVYSVSLQMITVYERKAQPPQN